MARVEVKSKDGEGNEMTLFVQKPTPKDKREARLYGNSVTAKLMKNPDCLLRSELMDVLRAKGKWSDVQQDKLDEIDEEIESKLMQIKSGGIKLGEARALALDVRKLRNRRTLMMIEYNNLDQYTAESQGQDAEFDYLMYICVRNDEGKNIYESVDDYLNKSEEQYSVDAASKLATVVYNLNEDWQSQLPENRFLKKYGFVNDKLELVNKEGKRVDTEGRVIDDNFNYVNEDGERVDEDGRVLDEDGLPRVEFSPFLDDDGNPV